MADFTSNTEARRRGASGREASGDAEHKMISQARMRSAVAGLRVAISSFAGFDALDARKRDIAIEATAEIAPRIRQEVMANFARSGIGHSPSSAERKYEQKNILQAAVANAFVSLDDRGIFIRMPPGYPDYVSGKNKTSFYKVANALHHGAVHQTHVRQVKYDLSNSYMTKGGKKRFKITGYSKRGRLGQKARRNLKRIVLSGQGGSVKHGYFGKNTLTVSTKNETAKSVAVGNGIVIIKPRPYFYLNDAQRIHLVNLFLRAYQRRVDAIMGVAA